jgi:hypothetical protein
MLQRMLILQADMCKLLYISDLAGILIIFDVTLILEENTVEYFLMRGVLNYIGSVDVRYLIHHFYILVFSILIYIFYMI